MTKSRILLVLIILAGIAATGFAQVDQNELENLPQVTFINYEGPYFRIDTREQIRQLGAELGRQVAVQDRGTGVSEETAAQTVSRETGSTTLFRAGSLNRYFVIHCVSDYEDGKLDADIFGLGVDTGVDHIRNLRRIVQGYLQEAYDYSESDASLLAEYITIYNAVYRGSWDFFTERYKSLVIDNLIQDRAGLSIRYDEWPGRTMMLIPLGHGGLSAIDTAAITDRRVIEELRREDDQGVPQRQDMVDLMERQAEEAEQRAQTQREAIRQEEERLAQQRQQALAEERRLAEERQRLSEQQRAGTVTDQQARQREQEIARQEQENLQRQQEQEQRERELERQREEAQRLEQYAEERFEAAQEQREEIARDQQAAITQETVGGVLGVSIERTDPVQMGRIIRLNPENGTQIRRSPVDTVHTRTVAFVSGKIIAIAGETTGNRAVRLIEINQTNLEMVRQGDDDIRTGSLLWVFGSDLYAITVVENQCYLGRFDTNLTLQAISNTRVHPEASVSIQQGVLLTQRENGSPLILNPMDLRDVVPGN